MYVEYTANGLHSNSKLANSCTVLYISTQLDVIIAMRMRSVNYFTIVICSIHTLQFVSWVIREVSNNQVHVVMDWNQSIDRWTPFLILHPSVWMDDVGWCINDDRLLLWEGTDSSNKLQPETTLDQVIKTSYRTYVDKTAIKIKEMNFECERKVCAAAAD